MSAPHQQAPSDAEPQDSRAGPHAAGVTTSLAEVIKGLPATLPDWQLRLDRVMTGRPLAEDMAWLAGGFLCALETSAPIEEALGFPEHWRRFHHRNRRKASITQLWILDGEPDHLPFAKRIEKDLARYRASAAFVSDGAGRTRPDRRRVLLLEFLQANAGQPASFETIRQHLRR